MREFFNLDNPRNAETNDDDDQPGADESDTQVTNNMTQSGCIQQALPSYIVLYCFIMSNTMHPSLLLLYPIYQL